MLNQFMRAEEVARELEVSKSYAYKLIQQLNTELRDKGYITIAGRVNRQYFRERLYQKNTKPLHLKSWYHKPTNRRRGLSLSFSVC